MKARLLKKLLNKTGYTVAYYKGYESPDYIGIGSALCHNLLRVDAKTLILTCATDTFKEGRKCIVHNAELLFIWDTLTELISTGQLREIIDGKDEIDNPLPVFTVEDGKLIETFTDHYGWPNTTVDGVIMYDNTYFPTRKEAIKYGVRNCESSIRIVTNTLEEKRQEVSRFEQILNKYQQQLAHLRGLDLIGPGTTSLFGNKQ